MPRTSSKPAAPATQKDPRRVAAGKKAAETRRRNKALAALAALFASTAGAANPENFEGECFSEVTPDMLAPVLNLPPPLPTTYALTEADVVRLDKLPPPLPRRNAGLAALHQRAMHLAFA